jgi:hypothetical protein
VNYRKWIARAVENWPAKVLSLALAIVLFVFHRMSTLEERFFTVPLNIERKGALMPSSSYPRMIRVSLKGEANSIYPIMEEDIEVYVDMEMFTVPGRYNVPVQWRKKGSAQGVEPLQVTVEPIEITISLDHKVSKFVPLAASLRGQVETDFTMTSYSLNPTQVIIDGPAELMGKVTELYTDPIDLDGRSEDFKLNVNILNSDPLIVLRGTGTTEFSGNISRIIPVRKINNIPIAISGLMDGLSGELEIKTAGIHLEGENQNAVQQFTPSPGFLYIDCSGITEPGIYVLKVNALPAENVDIHMEPEEIEIQISSAGVVNQ